MTTTKDLDKTKVKQKNKGPLRLEAIIPFSIILILWITYSHLFMDTHLKKFFEWAGYQTFGAEVNIDSLETSFFKASLEISNIQMTNGLKPTHNSLVIGLIKFKMSWDALLRAKVLIDEMSVTQIQMDSKRKYKGKVKPPAPPSTGDDALTKALQETQNKALGVIEKKNEDNIMGSLTQLLSGKANEEEIKNKIQSSLLSQNKIKDAEVFIKTKEGEWKERVKTLPTNQDFQKIQSDFNLIQTQNFKSPDEIQKSILQLQSVLAQLDEKIKTVEKASQDLKTDSQKIEQSLNEVNTAFKNDLAQLQKYLSFPSIDLSSLIETLIKDQTTPYLAKIGYYRDMAYKYMPPNLGKKENPDEIDLALQPRPRDKGKVYEFGRIGSYPLFWIKKIEVSSKENNALEIGNLRGQILNLSSNQVLTQKPTLIQFKGDFPSQKIEGLLFEGLFDNRKKDSEISYSFKINQTPVGHQTFLDSNDLKINLLPTLGSFESSGKLKKFKDLELNFNKKITPTSFEVQSENADLKDSFGRVFLDINQFYFQAGVIGQLPHLTYKFDTDLLSKLQKGIGQEVGRVLNNFKQKAEADIKKSLDKEKERLNDQIKAFDQQVKNQVLEVQSKANQEKNKIEKQKRDLENQIQNMAQQKINEEKSKIEAEAKKAAEELKKKLGL